MEVTIAEMSSAVKGREGETWLSVDPFVESDVVEGLLLAGVAELLGRLSDVRSEPLAERDLSMVVTILGMSAAVRLSAVLSSSVRRWRLSVLRPSSPFSLLCLVLFRDVVVAAADLPFADPWGVFFVAVFLFGIADNCVGHKVIGHEVFMLNVFSARALSILFGTQLNFLLCTLVPCADSFVIPLFCYMPVAPSNINSFKQSFKSHSNLWIHNCEITIAMNNEKHTL